MRFLIIIICLLSERYLTHKFFKFRKNWPLVYDNYIDKLVPANIINATPYLRFIVYLGSLSLCCLIFHLLGHRGLGLILNFIFAFTVFYFCLGEHNLFYLNTNEKKILTDNELIVTMNREFYAIIFWFYLLGPIGAILYKTTNYFTFKDCASESMIKLQAFLDWMTVRISAVLFLLVGHFKPGYFELLKKLNQNPLHNNELLITVARDALGVDDHEPIETMQLQNLFNHSCLLLIFLLAIFVIGTII